MSAEAPGRQAGLESPNPATPESASRGGAEPNQQTTRKVAFATGASLTPSVQQLYSLLPPQQPVTAWDVTAALLAGSAHERYGGGRAREVVDAGPPPTAGSRRTVAQWIAGVEALLRPGVSPLHGRLLIAGLARLDPPLAEHLGRSGFLEALLSEIREPQELLFADAVAPSAGPGFAADPTPLAADWPEVADRLNRRGLARAIARRIDNVYADNDARGAPGGFMLHVHGEWGSGKTSLLRMVGQELHGLHPAPAPGWVVVEFNAWKHQRVDPPWWFLMDAVFRAGFRYLWSRAGTRPRALGLWLREHGWRLATGRRDAVFAAGLLLLFLAATYFVLRLSGVDPRMLNALAGGSDSLAKVFALLGTLAGGSLLFSRSLLSGGARAAQKFVEDVADPMERLSRHFGQQVERIGAPLFVFVDDLDRCQPAYVVQLLEGIQTLFNDRHVVYAVAADRKWLDACYENQYDWARERINEPGRPLGTLFLEKQFQLSVGIPRLQPMAQAEYWRHLLAGGSDAEQVAERALEAARITLRDARSEQAVLDAVAGAAADPERALAMRQAAVERLAERDVERSTELFLAPFAPLLEPNPRAMKRLLNAYALSRDMAVIDGLEVLTDARLRGQLVLWTVLTMRWPDIERRIVDCFEEAADVEAAIGVLLAPPAVRQVIDGGPHGATLDVPAMRLFARSMLYGRAPA